MGRLFGKAKEERQELAVAQEQGIQPPPPLPVPPLPPIESGEVRVQVITWEDLINQRLSYLEERIDHLISLTEGKLDQTALDKSK